MENNVSSLKRKENPEKESFQQVKRVADHYNQRADGKSCERQDSPLAFLRNFNNWVKATLIKKWSGLNPKVIDLACGKGGDLKKWKHAREYLGIDLAEESIKDAKGRVSDFKWDEKKFILRQGDFHSVSLPLIHFDICSIQFALHYAFSSQESALQVLRNVSNALKPGGYFIGTIPDAEKIKAWDNSSQHCQIHFAFPEVPKKYTFHLTGAIDGCPEFLVENLKELAQSVGLEQIETFNFEAYLDQASPQEKDMMRFFKLDFSQNQKDQLQIAFLYRTFVFIKN
jgi:mRNA (guanine-N7-)-methyltransferase